MSTPLRTGDTLSFRKTLTVAEQAFYTGISGNLAPLYVDQRAAREAGFEAMLAFELHGTALATTALNRLAGPAWRLGGLQMDYTQPVLVGQTVEARVLVLEVAPDELRCTVTCTLAGIPAVPGGPGEPASAPSGAVVAQGWARLVPVCAAAQG